MGLKQYLTRVLKISVTLLFGLKNLVFGNSKTLTPFSLGLNAYFGNFIVIIVWRNIIISALPNMTKVEMELKKH